MSVELHSNPSSFLSRSPDVAYLWAVTAAALCFLLLTGIYVIYQNGIANLQIRYLPFFLLMFFFVCWPVAFFTSFVPFLIGWEIAKKFSITHWSFFVLGATFTGIFLAPLGTANLGINEQGDFPPFMERFLFVIPYFSASGAVAGITCWIILRRRQSKILQCTQSLN